MSNFRKYLGSGAVEYPADIKQLKDAIPELYMVPNTTVEKMYKAFSDSYSAGWLCVDKDRIEEFKEWLFK